MNHERLLRGIVAHYLGYLAFCGGRFLIQPRSEGLLGLQMAQCRVLSVNLRHQFRYLEPYRVGLKKQSSVRRSKACLLVAVV